MRTTLLWAFLRRDFEIQLSYRADLLMSTASTVLTLALFFYVGELVDGSDLAEETGSDAGYFGYVAIGLVLFRILSTSLNSFANRLRNEQTSGTLEAMLATPVRSSTAILFSAAFDLVRATFFAMVLLIAAIVLFGLRLDTDALGVLVAIVTLAGSLCVFASIGMGLAAFTVVYKQSSAALGLATSGVALLSGVYFPLTVLPEGIQAIGQLIPMTWAVDVCRSALLHGEIQVDRFLLLIGSAVILLPAALWMIERAVARSRRQGSLAHY
jgi:ABC-2 type transport system permease protein